MVTKPRQHVAYIILVSAVLFGCSYSAYVVDSVSGANLDISEWLLLLGKTAVELVAASYGIAFLVSALAFLLIREPATRVRHRGSATEPPVGIIYLCYDDADWSALESLTRLSYGGPLFLVIHDDSRGERARETVDAMASHLATRRDWDVRVLRRPHKSGGKAGAVNYALDETAYLYEYFLLCDNDSTVLDPDTIQRALAHMHASHVGGVQFRSVPVADPGYCGANRRLAESIGAFHAFLAPAAQYGWMPFIGHNALLRTGAVQQVGGLTPDFFSDDLDLTVRLNLAGFRITYAPEIEMGEKHPPSYTAFRKRSYKWAYGCVQTLRAHSWNVLTAPQFSFAEKLSFFQFAGFYCLQSLLLAYLCFALIAVPLGALGTFVPEFIPSLIVGAVLVGLVYAPLLSFYVKTPAKRRSGWLTTLLLCGLVYGGTDFSVFRGVTDALRRRRRAWIPTNGVSATAIDPALFGEAGFGLVLLSVPIVYFPELLYLPAWFVFAGKFLFGPALSLVYRDHPDAALAPFADADLRDQPVVVFDAEARPTFERVGAS
jgi:cellulose synthase/poly-beta-1,6-N-acetylglucosamine synthase-like glycosyltransferase